MLPQVDWAKSNDHAILIMDPNCNTDSETSLPIKMSETREIHSLHVWKQYVRKSGFSKVHIIANKEGGLCVSKI